MNTKINQPIPNAHNKPKKDKSSSVALENAFVINIKNEREEVMRNMENLRKSVKLKKRANPLEKNMIKISKLSSDDSFNDSNKKSDALIKNCNKSNYLQAIDESLEED